MTPYMLEVCVDSADSALIAANAGASRLELCSNLIIGGTTPTTALIELTKELVSIPVHVLIRPRFGDFFYTQLEVETMKRNIVSARNHLADGVVIGATTQDGQLDKAILQMLIELSGDMHLTLHRAFDVCKDPFETLETAIELGFHTILTSGQAATAQEGIGLIDELIKQANGRITIMPGAGITPDSIGELATKTAAQVFHLSAKELRQSPVSHHNPSVHMGLPGIDESTIFSTSADTIKKIWHTLETL